MPASQKISKKIGIIAGTGDLPKYIYNAAIDKGYSPHVIALKTFADEDFVIDLPNASWFRIGALGAMVKHLKLNNITDIIMIGGLGKPSLKTLRPDIKGLQFLAQIKYNDLGDDGLLRALKTFLNKQNINIIGAHSIAPELLTPHGILTQKSPSKSEQQTIQVGVKAALNLGQTDKGQAVLAHKKGVIAEEDRHGTNALMKKSLPYKNDDDKPILVKLCKPEQDQDMDMPTAGLHTVKKAIDFGIGGIVLHAGTSLFIHRDKAIALADKHNIFIQGVNPNDV